MFAIFSTQASIDAAISSTAPLKTMADGATLTTDIATVPSRKRPMRDTEDWLDKYKYGEA